MRIIVGIVLLLVGTGLALSRWEGLAAPPLPAEREANWVRTAQGWERHDAWLAEPNPPPPLHPLVVAAAQGLSSLLALTAFGKSVRCSRQRLWAMLWTGR